LDQNRERLILERATHASWSDTDRIERGCHAESEIMPKPLEIASGKSFPGTAGNVGINIMVGSKKLRPACSCVGTSNRAFMPSKVLYYCYPIENRGADSNKESKRPSVFTVPIDRFSMSRSEIPESHQAHRVREGHFNTLGSL